MRIIIAYASVGAGHLKAAEALYKHISADKHHSVSMVDVLEQSRPFFRNFYRRSYDFMVEYLPSFWALCYFIAQARFFRPLIRHLHLSVNRINSRKFMRDMIGLNPDYILSTHFLPSQLAAYLKTKGRIKSRIFTVITDFDIHSFWVAEGTNRYFVACDFTKARLVRQGVSPQDIQATGIPVDYKFLRTIARKDVCVKLGIDEDKFTALVITGSFGIGPLEEIVDALHQDVQLLVVCARNTRLHTRLKKKAYPSVKIFGFVDNTEELMAVADVIITKPGGLTISEFLAREVVPVFICAIPGQEKKNIRVLASYGIGREARTAAQTKKAVLDYKERPKDMLKVKQGIRQLRKPFAAEELYNAICQGGSGSARRGTL